MATKYFICIRPGNNGSHTVHNEDCPFLPEPGKRVFLGTFKSARDAMEEGRKYCNFPVRCIFCSKEHHHENRISEFTKMLNDRYFITSGQLRFNRASVMLCSLN